MEELNLIKKIHYCWFGGKKLPKEVKKCIATWKKMLPDYEIIEWNESKFDVNKIPFVKSAYENKKWAFVSDYVRTYALYEEGGLYLDTDVKILKDVSKIIDKNLVFGYEDSGYFGTAVIATNKVHNPYIKEVLKYYDNIENINLDIIYNYANPAIITRIINKYPVELKQDGIKVFNSDVYVYPRDYFYPLSYNYAEKIYTQNTCMVHLFNGTWTDKGEQRTINLYRKFGLGFGGFLNNLIDFIFSIKSNLKKSLYKIYNFVKMKYSIYINRNKRVKNIKNILNNQKEKYVIIYDPDVAEIKDIANRNFKQNILEIRQQHTKKEAQMIAKQIIDAGKEKVIFNFYTKGWDDIISHLKKLNPKIKIKDIIYKSNAYLSNLYYWEIHNNLLDLYFKGLIDEFGFTNKSLYNFYKQKGYNSSLIFNNINIENKEEIIKNKNKHSDIKVGMYYNVDNFENNIFNGLSAVSLIENVSLDCIPLNYKISNIAKKYDITLSGNTNMVSKEELYKKLSQNDINLYIPFTDTLCLLPLESLELGTPCIVGNSTSYFLGTKLEEYLVVKNVDDINEIYNKIKYVLENKEKILELYKQWRNEYIEKSKQSIEDFINN